MTERLLPPPEYVPLLTRLLKLPRATRAALDLCSAHWTTVLDRQHCHVLLDPTGQWVCKVNLNRDPGYEEFASTLAEPGGLHSPHEPYVVWHGCMQNGKGSLTLLERLLPLKGPSRLLQHRDAIIRGAQVQYDHLTCAVPQFGGSLPAIGTAIGVADENFVRLASLLGAVMVMSDTALEKWHHTDVMRRADGTEVLIDPFEPMPRHVMAHYRQRVA